MGRVCQDPPQPPRLPVLAIGCGTCQVTWHFGAVSAHATAEGIPWELKFRNWLQGSREYAPQQIVDQLGLGTKMAARKGPGQAQMMPPQAPPGARFIQPISECEFTINAALDELMHDAFPRLSEHRPNRCTGTAVQVSAWHAWAKLQWDGRLASLRHPHLCCCDQH